MKLLSGRSDRDCLRFSRGSGARHSPGGADGRSDGLGQLKLGRTEPAQNRAETLLAPRKHRHRVHDDRSGTSPVRSVRLRWLGDSALACLRHVEAAVRRRHGRNPHSDTPYFRKIAGADLDDAEGAQSDFLALWRNAIASARDSKMPGIVFDQEFYNNYAEYDIGELSRESGKKPAEVVSKFEALGARMADIASQEYPDSVLWFLWTGLTHAGYKTYDGVSYYPSPTYIAIGLLDEIAQKRLRLRVLTGGEGSLGYCHDTLDDFRSAIGKRDSDMKSTLEKYSGILETAGTMTLWSDRRANQVCKTASAPTIEDLEPYLDLLFESYRYNWIWASGDGGYLAFAPGVAPRFDAVIRRSKARSWTTPSTR